MRSAEPRSLKSTSGRPGSMGRCGTGGARVCYIGNTHTQIWIFKQVNTHIHINTNKNIDINICIDIGTQREREIDR